MVLVNRLSRPVFDTLGVVVLAGCLDAAPRQDGDAKSTATLERDGSAREFFGLELVLSCWRRIPR
jgi:hypothetical protein